GEERSGEAADKEMLVGKLSSVERTKTVNRESTRSQLCLTRPLEPNLTLLGLRRSSFSGCCGLCFDSLLASHLHSLLPPPLRPRLCPFTFTSLAPRLQLSLLPWRLTCLIQARRAPCTGYSCEEIWAHETIFSGCNCWAPTLNKNVLAVLVAPTLRQVSSWSWSWSWSWTREPIHPFETTSHLFQRVGHNRHKKCRKGLSLPICDAQFPDCCRAIQTILLVDLLRGVM
ncbi:hypothetical protein CLAIMM_01491, partial [Cladophialophora immunda]